MSDHTDAKAWLAHYLSEELPKDELAHYGVLGMKWGVRKDRDGAVLTSKLKNGGTLTITKDPPSPIVRGLSKLSKRYAERAESVGYFTLRDASEKKVGDAVIYRSGPEELNLVWINVKSKHRGQGYATAALKGVVEYARDNGIKNLTLEVPGNAPDALHIYTKLGFKPTGEHTGTTDDVWGGLTHMSMSVTPRALRHTSPTLKDLMSYIVSAINEAHEDNMNTTNIPEDELAHYGVLGMKWGVRKDRLTASGIKNRKIDRDAKRDAKEHIQAKLYYGEGAGTRRKLIKAKVESKAKKSSEYKKAFDYHVNNQDVEKRLTQVQGQRKRKDVRNTTAKTTRGLINIARGNMRAVGASLAATAAVVMFVRRTGLDRQAYNAVVNSSIGRTTISRGKQFISGLF